MSAPAEGLPWALAGIAALRSVGCALPVELFVEYDIDGAVGRRARELGAALVDFRALPGGVPPAALAGGTGRPRWALKVLALYAASFAHGAELSMLP